MSGEFVSKPSCILAVIVFILLVSSTGLLVMVLKGQFSHPSEEHESIQDMSGHHPFDGMPDIQSDQAPPPPPDNQTDHSPPPSPDIDTPWKSYRLAGYVRPLHYDIHLWPDLHAATFNGTVEIEINVTVRTRYFVVHAVGLDVQKVTVGDVRQCVGLEVEETFYYKRNEFFVVEVAKEVEIGVYGLFFAFSGRLDRGIVGFYRSSYTNSRNETRYLATSKFQPGHARKAFPCFDEPGFKSTFNISLVHDEGYTALSNMPPEVTEPLPGTDLYVTKFQKSVPMVTYLPCFIVCDFLYTERILPSGKPFRVYSAPDEVNKTAYALETGSRILEHFEKYFGIDYTLPKLDLIAIPTYPSSATEHWGLITFKYAALLYDPESNTASEQQTVAAVVSHELVHMWFGNLVTMEWWDEFWLNEGFASYIEYEGLYLVHPDWDMQSQFLVEDMYKVMAIDSTNRRNPIVHPITHLSGIHQGFTDIAYKKGASVLRMLESFVGSESFRKGISSFLQKYKYKNAKTSDLLEELSSACGRQGDRSVQDIMKTWTEQSGFPYVTVVRKGVNSSTFVAKQQIFIETETNYDQKVDLSQKWSIPLSYTSSKGASGIVWMHDEEVEFSLPVQGTEWVKFNVNQTGYYLVNYETDEWKKLTDLLLTDHEALTPSDRSSLLFNSLLLAKAGHVGADLCLTLTTYLKIETHYTPWKTAETVFLHLQRMIQDEEDSLRFQKYMTYLTSDLYKTLGWNASTNHLDNLLRPSIIGMACSSGDSACLGHASELLSKKSKDASIPVDVWRLVDIFGEKSFVGDCNTMWSKHLVAASPHQETDHLEGLAFVREPYLTQRHPKMSYSISSEEEFEMRKYFGYYSSPKMPISQQDLDKMQKNIVRRRAILQEIKTWLELQSPAPWLYHRLPSYIVPLHYDLLLHPMLDRDAFNGSVAITVELRRPSSHLLVHSVDLNVSRIEVTYEVENASKTSPIEEVFRHQDYLVIKTAKELPVGRYKLYFEFAGPLTLSLRGLYKSSYVDPVLNERRYLATTQFESIDARRAFPCFDEPRLKTTFDVSVVHEPRHIALSNALVECTTEWRNGLRLTRFQKTPPMVTYLLAVAVCDFAFKETTTDNGVKLRIYTAPHHIEKTYYALEVGSKVLTYYENYFGIPFPLKKLDMIAVPDFNANGMENWGLVTFSEESLICENVSTVETTRRIINIIGHELAHMWFGDLVTMEWWNDLWLNEGFATYISERGSKFVEPKFQKIDDWGTFRLMKAMSIDQSVNSHPIVQPVTCVTSAIFDGITYMKGSSVLRMLENYMGEDFRMGVSAYLKNYSFGNAKTEDLWDALTNASRQGLNVSTLMRTWTHQMNYPLLTVERNESGCYFILQQRYSTGTKKEERTPKEYVWQIPVAYRASNSDEISYLLLKTSEKVELCLPGSEWVKLNLGFNGFYSVNYDTLSWMKFIQIFETDHTLLGPSDRLNLLSDAFSLSSERLLEYDVALRLTRHLGREEDPAVWSFALKELGKIQRYFGEDVDTRETMKEYIRSLSKDLLKKYTWNDTEDYSERKLRKKLIEAACSSGNQDCLRTAGSLFKLWMEGQALSPETKLYVYVYGLRTNDSSDSWNFVWNRYLGERDPHEKQLLLKALSSVRNEEHLERLMEYARDEQLVRKHDFFEVMSRIAWTPKGHPLVTRLIFNNWTELAGNHGVFYTEQFARDVFSHFTSKRNLEKIKEFYKKIPETKETGKLRSTAIENINRNIHWIERHRDRVRTWFQDNVRMPWKNPRLPHHVTPTSYNITIRPNNDEVDFEGEVGIELVVANATDHVIVHQSGLAISGVELRSLSTRDAVDIEEEFAYERHEFYVIRLKGEIQGGRYVLRMKFSEEYYSFGYGVGQYNYTHRITNETRYLWATMFEPTFARRVFPCFDEPAMKATFQLNVVHDPGLKAVSNMPEVGTVLLESGFEKTVFMETVRMSSYLLFCAVFDFEYLQADYKGKQVRAYAPPDRLLEEEYRLNMTLKILPKLEEYFGLPYPLPKLDSIAIPGYPVAGMENWGAIAYFADLFLVDESTSTHQRALMVDGVIAHELVHQWIGNLVTMEWWDDLWLKEGLTSFLMYMPIREYHPAIKEVDVRMMSELMCLDSTALSHPILVKTTTTEEIVNTFDVITYQKAAAVLMMLQHTLKEDFRKGISTYLKKYAYKNAVTEDLWTELSDASTAAINVSEMMDTWIRQLGFPYVQLHRKGEMVTATQRWLVRTSNRSAATKITPFGSVWKIPLVYKNLRTGIEYTLWLNEKNATFQINAASGDVVKFNPGFVGFYVVNYDAHDWARLGQRLRQNHTSLGVTDRYNLLHDAFLLAGTDHVSYELSLQLSRYLVRESESLPWSLFKDQFLNIAGRLDRRSEAATLLKEYVAELTSKLYDERIVTIQNKTYFKKWKGRLSECNHEVPHPDVLHIVVELACRSSYRKCVDAMTRELQLWMDGRNPTVDLQLVFGVAIQHSENDTLWEHLYEEMTSQEAKESAKHLMAEGLASFSHPRLVNKTIEVMAQDPRVHSDLAQFLFHNLTDNPAALPLLWEYAKDHWTPLLNRLDAGYNKSAVLSAFCEKFKTVQQLDDLIVFTKQMPNASEYDVESCVEEIQDAIEWNEKYEETITTWLTWNVNK